MSTQLKVSQLKPMPGYILVEPAKAETRTKAGIYLAENDEKPQHGKVLACGDTAVIDGAKVECPVKKGNKVIYKKWGGNEVKIEDVEYQSLKFDDVMAVVK